MIYGTQVCQAEYFPECLDGVLGLHFQNCLVVRSVSAQTVEQTSCENNEHSEWKSLKGPDKDKGGMPFKAHT